MSRLSLAALLLSPFLFGLTTQAADPTPLALGADAPDFDLPGVDGKNHKLADYADAKILMVVFTCNHCPTAQAYEDRLIKMTNEYRPKGVALVAISPNDPRAVRLDELGYTDLDDSFDDMKQRAKDKQFPFHYLYDGETQSVSKAYGVLATPHVYIFDQKRKLRYIGRIDDGEVKPVKSHDTRNALDALLAGSEVPVASTRVFGCSTKWADKRESAKQSLAKWDSEPVKLEKVDAAGLKALAANPTKKLRLINVWATWCGPCVEELPDLVTMHRMYRGRPFEMVTLSLDEAAKADQALEVLTKHHVSAKNLIFGSDDHDAAAEALDPKWPGPVPYTLLVAPGGQVLYRKTGPIEPLELKKAIVGYLGRTY